MTKQLSVLIIEDSESDAALNIRELKKAGYDVLSERVETALQMINAFKKRQWDVIISDNSLPQFDSLGALAVLKETGQDIPFIVVSGAIGEETAVKIMKAGANDYVMKGNLARLASSIERELRDVMVRRDLKIEEEKYHRSGRQWRSTFDVITDAVCLMDNQSKIIRCNKAMKDMIGKPFKEIIGQNCWELVHNSPSPITDCPMARLQKSNQHETLLWQSGDHWFKVTVDPVQSDDGTFAGAIHVITDVTKSYRLQLQQILTNKILEILNKDEDKQTVIRGILLLIKEFSGCEAVGIRLKDGEDFPYYQTNGFMPGHVETENHLCAYDEKGELIRDSKGNPVLECMCGNILCGRFDPTKSFFTKRGSFWSNCTTNLLSSTTEEDRQSRTRNKCNGEGYESVALIPLKSGNDIIGLLQLNDSRRDRFTADLIEYFEDIGQSIGISLARLEIAEALRESENLFRVVQEMSPDGFTILHPLRNEKGEIIDFTWVYENKTIARINGTDPEEVKDKRMLNLFPTHNGTSIFEAYIYVSNSGKPQIIEEVYVGEIVSRPTWLRLVVVSIGEDIAILAQDITERKQAEEERNTLNQRLQKAVDGMIYAVALVSETRDPYTAGHQKQVSKLASAIAVEMGLSTEQIETIRIAGILHDIGKIQIPAEILSKPGKLSDGEMNLIKTHPQVGYDIVKTLELPWKICPAVHHHHERMDGSGYPSGQSGEHIAIEAKVIAVADVVEAMASHRPYRPALGIDKALEEIDKNKGKLYDTNVADACLKLFREKAFKFE